MAELVFPAKRLFLHQKRQDHMAPRANWKGYLKLSLVSCAVALFPATTTTQRIRFNIINRETGNRVRNAVVDAETGEPVPEEDRVKGYREKGGDYILLEDAELDRVALESTHSLEIEQLVPREEVDEIYLDESFYLAPTDDVSAEAFAVIRDAMRKTDMVGLARVVLYRRERLLMLQPRGKGLMATAIRYRNEVRDEDAYFDDIPTVKVAGDMLDLAVHILKSKEGHFDPAQFEDRYEAGLSDLIKAKQAGKPVPEPSMPQPSNVVSLMDALRRSVQTEHGPAERSGKPPERRAERGRSTGRKGAGGRGGRMKRAS
jgi:DNA end-binding protein Ku